MGRAPAWGLRRFRRLAVGRRRQARAGRHEFARRMGWDGGEAEADLPSPIWQVDWFSTGGSDHRLERVFVSPPVGSPGVEITSESYGILRLCTGTGMASRTSPDEPARGPRRWPPSPKALPWSEYSHPFRVKTNSRRPSLKGWQYLAQGNALGSGGNALGSGGQGPHRPGGCHRPGEVPRALPWA